MRKSTFTKAHKLLACLMVVCMLVACLPLSLIASAYQLNADTVLADVDFDENNIVLNFGVIADQHITYFGYTHDTVKNKVQQYANAVAALNKAAGNQLDGVLNTGDFTSHGNAYQAENFTSATKAIFDAINADAATSGVTTKFMIAYGNHDTSWRSNMPISDYAYDAAYHKEQNLTLGTGTSLSGQSDTWEEILNEYGLLDDQGAVSWDDIDGDGTDDYLEGTYLYTITARNGKKYYFIALETIDYAPNEYDNSTIQWLDKKLAEITAADPTAYVYIGSHAPIAGSGIYGTNSTYDKNAGWGSTDNDVLHNVLKKYPQVVYFSGHTHYGTIPETAIMSDTYTAIAVSAMAESGIFSGSSGYDYDNAGSSSMKNTGLNLLVQVDANGNQRIKRVVTPTDYNAVKLMSLTSETATGIIPKYDGNVWAPTEGANSQWNIVKTTGATLNTSALDAYDVATFGEDYLMPAPSADNSHLRYYSKERGEGAKIAFDADDKITLSEAVYSNKNGLSAKVTFNTATADRNILQYRVTFKNEYGAVLKTQMFAGNIYDITSGVSKGTTHCDATELTYMVGGITSAKANIYAEVVAVDEYFNTSAPIVSEVIVPEEAGDAPLFNAAVNTNVFDNIQCVTKTKAAEEGFNYTIDETLMISNNADYFNVTAGYKSLTASWTNSQIASQPWSKVVFWTDPAGYTAYYNAVGGKSAGWGINQRYAKYSTPFGVDDTFVYQVTVNTSAIKSGEVRINFRSEDLANRSGSGNDIDRQGLMLNTGGVHLTRGHSVANNIYATNSSFKMSADNTDHVVTILSSPEWTSVWIDNEPIFTKVSYPDDDVLSTLYPATTIWVNGYDVVVKDFYMWEYVTEEKIDTVGPNELSYNTLVTPVVDAAAKDIFTTSTNGFIFDLSQAGYDKIGQTNVNIDYYVYPFGYQVYPFAANDTWTFEYDLTATNFISTGDPRVKFTLGNITTASGVKKDVTVMMQGSYQFIVDPVAGWKQIANTGVIWNAEGATTHFKYTVNGNESIVYEISQGSNKYTYTYDLEAVFGEGYTFTPAVSLSYKKAKLDVKNIKLSVNGKYGDPIEGMTAPTEQNNLLNTNVNWTTNYKGAKFAPQFFGNNAYFNNYCEAQKINGLSAFYTGYTIDPMPAYGYEQTKSYVVSMNVKKSNRATEPVYGGTSGAYTSRFYVIFGQYAGKEVSVFIDDANIYTLMNGAYSSFASPVVKAIGLNEYYRYTASITPFGVTLYINGAKVHTIEFSDPSLFVPNVDFRINGTEIWLKDVAIWENTDNGQVYYDKINDKYQYLTTDKPGVRLDYSAEDQATLAEVKAALDSFNGKDSTPLRPYLSTLNSLRLPTVVNNLVADGSTIVGASASHVLGHSGDNDWKYGNLKLFNGTSPFTPADDFIVEADLYFTDVWYNTRIGFALNDVADGDLMLQQNAQFVNTQASSWSQDYATTNGTRVTCKNLANQWHVKYIVKGGESIQTVITDLRDGSLVFDYTAPWEVLRTASTNKEYFSPVFYYACCSVELKNIYVGYDVTEAKDALNATVTEYAAKDTNGFSAESVKAFTDALANANKILGVYEQYSNAEINAANEAVVSTFGALEKATVNVPVGDVEVEIDPSDLPVNERVDTKFVLGWKNPDGTKYEGTTYVPGLVAEFVETKMMRVKYQLGNSGNAIRYIASIDETERYNSVGWLFSLNNTEPEIGDADVAERKSSKVYRSLLASGVETFTKDIFTDVECSTFLYVFEITDIPEAAADSVVYVRPYVEMVDGTIVYGDVSTRSLNQLKQPQ